MTANDNKSPGTVHPAWRLVTCAVLSGLLIHAIFARKVRPPLDTDGTAPTAQLPPPDPRLLKKFDHIDHEYISREQAIIDLAERAGLSIVVRHSVDPAADMPVTLHLENAKVEDALNGLTMESPEGSIAWIECNGVICVSDGLRENEAFLPLVYDVEALLEKHDAEEGCQRSAVKAASAPPHPTADPFHRADWLMDKIVVTIPGAVMEVGDFRNHRTAMSFEPDRLVITASMAGHRAIQKLLHQLEQE